MAPFVGYILFIGIFVGYRSLPPVGSAFRFDLALDYLEDPSQNPDGFYSKEAVGFNIYLISYVVVIGYLNPKPETRNPKPDT